MHTESPKNALWVNSVTTELCSGQKFISSKILIFCNAKVVGLGEIQIFDRTISQNVYSW